MVRRRRFRTSRLGDGFDVIRWVVQADSLPAPAYHRARYDAPCVSGAGGDLAELVHLGALLRTGAFRGTRYWLPFGAPDPRHAAARDA